MTELATTSNLQVSLQASFEAHSMQLQQNNAALFELKSKALDKFLLSGMPSKKVEDYKYFPLDALNKTELQPVFKFGEKNSTEEAPENETTIELINGVDVKFKSLDCNAIQATPFRLLSSEKQENVLSAINGRVLENDPTFLLNQAFFSELLFIEINNNDTANTTIRLLHTIESNEQGNWIFPKIVLLANENSTVTVIEEFNGTQQVAFCISSVHVVCEKGAHVKWHKIQDHKGMELLVDNTLASVKQNAGFEIFTATLEGKKVRNNLAISLDSEQCEAHLNGFYFPASGQIFDNHTSVDHRFARCESNEYYKGAIGNGGQAIFNGKVFVRQDAQKTNAYQSNKNILLGEDAAINTKPQLEIYADDVKCSHGSSTGFIDTDALFYLQSRGISRSSAQSLLLSAFAADVLNKISDEQLCNRLIEQVNSKITRINL